MSQAAPRPRRKGWDVWHTVLLLLLLFQLAEGVLRLSAPFTEPAAYGRSAVNATIARNFHEHGYRFFYPQLDYGHAPGYVGVELPLVPYVVAMVYPVTGIHDAAGRAVPLAFGLTTTLLIFLIGRYLFHSRAAAVAAAALVVVSPMFAFFSRTFQSDSAMICLLCAALLALVARRERGGRWRLAAAIAATSLAMLLKPSSMSVFPALLLVLWPLGRRMWTDALALSVVVLAALIAYYHHAAVINQYTEIGLGVVARRATLQNILNVQYAVQNAKDVLQTITPLGAIGTVAGVALSVANRRLLFLPVWLFGAVGLNLIFNEALAHHEYYQLLWLPGAALLTGATIDWFGSLPRPTNRRAAMAMSVVAVLAGLTVAMHFQFMRLRLAFPEAAELRLAAGLLARAHTPQGAMITAEDVDILYYANRRGWIYFTDPGEGDLVHAETLAERRTFGAAYVVSSNGSSIFSPDALTLLARHTELVEQQGALVLWRFRR